MDYGAQLIRLLEQPGVGTKAEVFESLTEVRMDEVSDPGVEFIKELQITSSYLTEHGLGTIVIFGTISGQEWSAENFTVENALEPIRVILRKLSTDDWVYFATVDGFRQWLKSFSAGQAIPPERLCVWVAGDFSAFATFQHAVRPFFADKLLPKIEQIPEKPWKLVRDLTHAYTPSSISPWLILESPTSPSFVYEAWSDTAKQNLAFCLPSEIRSEGDVVEAVFRGGRSLPVAVKKVDWSTVDYGSFSEACSWVYATPREAETKFQLLNNHLAINWNQGSEWPEGSGQVLDNSLAGAKEAFAFHLQDQSKEAVKGLGDLRKGLQEEVAKTQAAARDLISAVWRDFAIAGVVLALKLPGSPITLDGKVIQSLYIATAVLLALSVFVSGFSTFRFNTLAGSSRKDWRNKLYSFMSDHDWQELVASPISSGIRVFWVIWGGVFYFAYRSLYTFYHLPFLGQLPIFSVCFFRVSESNS
ncbi:hypothetical protein ALP36_02731 [Pseudomonas syringae pv. coriandricola]|uniref:Uncharacterized protein n=1 Tax=Pseudomonas syringae pv. coriandricola TaxID=264453 RepID=A0A3M5RLR6_9PSED|nr:hypothetical protein [Pseudomonas syringae group genomosp. 3]RMR31331.1 hypothetical protein ALP87_04017 [Pseudomonas syringae pv. coriandricola]RMU09956.1 hypothetical protein ALP36_02731 [Pseudomonas syringae pv. coriandricola]